MPASGLRHDNLEQTASQLRHKPLGLRQHPAPNSREHVLGKPHRQFILHPLQRAADTALSMAFSTPALSSGTASTRSKPSGAWIKR